MATDVTYTIGADASKYEKAIGRVKSVTTKVGSHIKNAFSAAAAVGAAVMASFVLMGKEALSAGDKIHKLNIRLGVSTEALSQYAHVANIAGVQTTQLTTGWQRMTRRVAEAAQGTGEAKNALFELGLSAEALNRLAPDAQFEAIANAMMDIENQSDKVRIAMKLFDSEGVGMLQMMTDGAEGMRRMRLEADALGLTLTQAGANRIASVNDAMARFKAGAMATAQMVVVALGPTIVELVDWLGSALPKAINIAIKAYNALSRAGVSVIKSVTSGLIKFYDMLGHLPAVGENYRWAADALRKYRFEMENFQAVQLETLDTAKKFTVAKGEGINFADIPMPDQAIKAQYRTPDQMAADKQAEMEHKRKAEQRQKELEEQEAFEIEAEERRLNRLSDQALKQWEIQKELEEKLKRLKQDSAAAQLSILRGLGTAALAVAGASSEQIFAMQKGVEIGQAVMAAYTASSLALANPPGPPATTPVAAAALKAGLFNAAAIAATSIGQMATSKSGSVGGGTYTSPVVSKDLGVDQKTEQNPDKGTLTINIHGDVLNEEYVDMLVEKINDAADREVFIHQSVKSRETS